ncbi:MAG: hypothetical protein ABI439_04985 [Rhodospirillales bacterium]
MQRFERTQIAANVAQGVRPYVHAFEARYGTLPHGYWEDEYVLGFVPAIAGLFATALTSGKIGEADRNAVVQECIETISPGFGQPVMQQLQGLMLTKPDDFVKAAEAAAKVMAFSMGQCPANDPDLIEAQRAARQERGGPAPDPASEFNDTARALLHRLFYDVVNQRLMGNTQIPETDGPPSQTIEIESEIDSSGSVVIKF